MERALDPGILTNLMNAFSFVLTGGFGRLMPDALSLLGKLAILELILIATWAWLSGDNVAVVVFIKMLWICGFVFLVSAWPSLTRILMTSFITAGLRGSGGVLTVEDFTNPAGIARFGLEVTAVLFAQVSRFTGFRAVFSLPMMVIDGFICLGIVVAFFLMAIQIFVTFCEFYLVSMLSPHSGALWRVSPHQLYWRAGHWRRRRVWHQVDGAGRHYECHAADPPDHAH